MLRDSLRAAKRVGEARKTGWRALENKMPESYSLIDTTMETRLESLAEIVSRLSPEKQAAVREFIEFIEHRKLEDTPFMKAVEEFVAEHEELLRLLAQGPSTVPPK